MSRTAKFAGRVGGRRFGKTAELAGIPMPPQVVLNVQTAMRERKRELCFTLCQNKARGPILPTGEFVGRWIANNLMNQIAVQMAERQRQSRIVVPKPGMVMPE